ncbi:hypothetical protein F441_17381 [Phytophthora nicotianae CJ01A1]|uniref:MULE transposase domain-containing protein n=4 Tax=Phytophthora nicotianae TaxID=4792 RepID=W2YHL4_PHYNI|nr:hypothetical protein L916_16942 [Phytophthora nicotianae]ETM36464.1 hypothetical protein L914_16852 [Phytophthora nicotianae]ETO65117.1 hypothetical protein F444_17553 [Phytophthora nicotianae P1976]ETP06159.1 hypothetical protein F441_17381 [Phytophthora nicotianae CJ01A1]ETP34292.1 hypothetical protein F442_17365 [Phytophthora nicotianae P10297]
MLSIVRQRSLEFFGLELRLRFGSLDHDAAIANVFKAEWLEITLLNCWAHLARKTGEKESILKSPSFISGVARVCLDYLHEARSPAQFSAMRDIVIAHWRACGEEAYATWLEAEYLSTNWYRWYRVSSGVAGVLRIPLSRITAASRKVLFNRYVHLQLVC